jgi:hypothetical protein
VISIFLAAGCFAFPPAFILAFRRATRQPLACPQFFLHWAMSAAGGSAGMMPGGAYLFASAYGASALLAMILWWWSRRKRRRSLKALGHKARARLAALVRNMPRPAPRLVPQGVPV